MITGTCRQVFKELSCFGVKFSNIHPASESGFLPGIFFGESIVMQISFFMLIFLLFSIVFKPIVFGGGANSRGKLLEGKAIRQPNNVSKHRKELFSKETLTNSCTVCHISNCEYVENIKTGINFLNKRQIS